MFQWFQLSWEVVKKRAQGVAITLITIFPTHSQAVDWDNFRGPAGNGISPEQGLTTWSTTGPQLLWKVPLNHGYSTFTSHGNRVYTQVTRAIGDSDKEVCLALDGTTGKELWAATIDGTDYDYGAGSGDGPRSTPVYYNGRIEVLSSFLTLVSLDAITGKEVWRRDLKTDFGGQVIAWQNSASPVVEDGRIFLNANGAPNTCLALKAEDGSLLWQATTEKTTHATPVLATILGTRQIVFLTQDGLVALQPTDGKELWRFKFPYSTSTGASPVIYEDMVYCSAAYGVGAAVARISQSNGKFSATQVWKKTTFKNHWGTPVCHHGYLYGLYGDSAYNTAPLKCIEMATGTEQWSQAGFGLGGLILVDGKLLVQSDAGEMVLAEATPDAYTELGRFQAVEGKSWNAPALSNGRLYARSISEGACYELIPQTTAAPLRWMTLLRPSATRFQWLIGATDDTQIEDSRLGKISILSSRIASTNVSDWSTAAVQLSLTNGYISVEGEFDSTIPLRFFKVVEEP
jgi:outer membrane protein assembly factor BamB